MLLTTSLRRIYGHPSWPNFHGSINTQAPGRWMLGGVKERKDSSIHWVSSQWGKWKYFSNMHVWWIYWVFMCALAILRYALERDMCISWLGAYLVCFAWNEYKWMTLLGHFYHNKIILLVGFSLGVVGLEVEVRKGVFGCKEVGGSKEMRKYNCLFPYLSKHRKRKIRKPLFLFSFLFYTIILSLPKCYS